MKKIRTVILSLTLMCCLVGCNRNANPKTENKLFFKDVMNTMEKNDSFQLETYNKGSLNGEEVINENISFRINNYYDDTKREALMQTTGTDEQLGDYTLNVVYLNQVTNMYINDEHQGSMFEPKKMYANIEFLKLDKKDIDTIERNEKEQKLTFTLNTKDTSIYNRLFLNDEQESDLKINMRECKYEFILNKDNTIKSSKRTLVFESEGMKIKRESEVKVINYKKQKIELPK